MQFTYAFVGILQGGHLGHILFSYMLMRFLSMYFLIYSITDDLKEIIDIDEHPD
jgi:hypothetical protein